MHRSRLVASFAIFMAVALTCSAAMAADWTMADGAVRFHTPANWTRIMSSPGEPQVMAFQVPDPSPTGKQTLARVVVTTAKAPDVASFKAVISRARERAATQPGVEIDKRRSNDTRLRYSADENGHRQVVEEHFALVHDHAVEVSCIRPAKSRAGAHWAHDFDAGCRAIVNQVK